MTLSLFQNRKKAFINTDHGKNMKKDCAYAKVLQYNTGINFCIIFFSLKYVFFPLYII